MTKKKEGKSKKKGEKRKTEMKKEEKKPLKIQENFIKFVDFTLLFFKKISYQEICRNSLNINSKLNSHVICEILNGYSYIFKKAISYQL